MFGGLFTTTGEKDAHRPTPSGFVFRAFVSYRSTDRRYAKWLQRRLEQYRLPSKLVESEAKAGRVLPSRLGRFYRDRADAAGSHDLAAEIEAALKASETLIVVCSPRAAEPTSWVSREIETFLRLRPDGRIFAVIAYGKPPGCFPAALLLPDGSGGIREPLAPDMRWHADGRRRSIAKLAAGLLCTDFDKLWRREKRRALGRALLTAAATLSGAAATAAAVFVIFTQAAQSDRRYVDQQIERAQAAYARGDDHGALEAALLALPANVAQPDMPYDRRAEVILSDVLANRALMFRCTQVARASDNAEVEESLIDALARCDGQVPAEILSSAKAEDGAEPVELQDVYGDQVLPPCDDPYQATALAQYLDEQQTTFGARGALWITDPMVCDWRLLQANMGAASTPIGHGGEWQTGSVADEDRAYRVTAYQSVPYSGEGAWDCIDQGRTCLITGGMQEQRRWLMDDGVLGGGSNIELRDLEGPVDGGALTNDGQYLIGPGRDGSLEVWDVRRLLDRRRTLTGAAHIKLPQIDDVSDSEREQFESGVIGANAVNGASLQSECARVPAEASFAAVDATRSWWAAASVDPGWDDPSGMDGERHILRIGRCQEGIILDRQFSEGALDRVGFTPDGRFVLAHGSDAMGASAMLVSLQSGIDYDFEDVDFSGVVNAVSALSLARLGVRWRSEVGLLLGYNLPPVCQDAVDAGTKAYAEVSATPLAREIRPLSFLLYRAGPFACGS